LTTVLSQPSAAALWRLRADLLELDLTAGQRLWPLLGEFHDYLDRIETGTSSRDYSNLASKLDIGAISGVLMERMAEPQASSELALNLLSGAISEGLMVLATRQHVKAWEGELCSVYRSAAWFLYDELWQWSCTRTPDLAAADRRRLLDEILAPIQADDTPGLHKAVLVGRLFQILLLSRLVETFPELGAPQPADE
jgi:hypothetical protein